MGNLTSMIKTVNDVILLGPTKSCAKIAMYQQFFHNSVDKSENTKPSNVFSWFVRSPHSCSSLYWFAGYLKDDLLRNEYSVEWKKYLLMKNAEEVRKWSKLKERFTFYTPKLVKSVFNICKMLGQPPEVRYLAVDILDRFLVEHFTRVCETFEEMKEENLDTWQATIERILNQSTLRILTCIQLAMKYAWSNNIILATEIQALMERLGNREQYRKKSILKSEARVFQHLSFNISGKTPLTYMEMFFDDFQHRQLFDNKTSIDSFFLTCVNVLDVAVIHHQQICRTYGEGQVLKVLAAAAIFTSFILEDPERSNFILQLLSSVGECSKADVEALSKRLFRVILDN